MSAVGIAPTVPTVAIPESWEWAPLGAVADIVTEGVDPEVSPLAMHVAPDNMESSTGRLLPCRTVAEDQVKSRNFQFKEGDVLYTKLRPYLNKVVRAPFDGLCSSDVLPIRPRIDGGYLSRWMLSRQFLSQVIPFQTGVTLPRISRVRLEQTRVPTPPLTEQRRIVEAVETRFARLDAAVRALERARANLKRYRASVLESACSGELVSKESSWRETRLIEIAEIRSGVQKQPSRRPKNHKYPFLRVANVLRGRLELDEVHEIELFDGELERLRLQPNDLLIVEGNGSRTEIGRMAIWDGSIPECVHQNHIIRARLRPEALPSFVQAYWNSPSGSAQVMAVSSSTSGLYTLSAGKVGKIRLPIPSVEEQVKIVMEVERRLSVADEASAEVEHGLSRCSHLRDALLRSAFEGRLVAQDPNDEPASVLLERVSRDRVPQPIRHARKTTATA